MRYKKGQSGNPNGRPKGAKDKIARSAKETIEKAVEQIGGVDELVAWAKKNNRNQEKLYDWYFKMLPSSIVGGQDDEGKFHPLKVIISNDGKDRAP